MKMTDVVLQDATRDRSFAGLFPYASNVPMKVFAGNEPSVPVSVLVDALDEMQGGGASQGTQAAAQARLAPQLSACMAQCQKQHESCLQSAAQGGSLSSVQSADWGKCQQNLMQMCIPKCMGGNQ